MKYFLISLGVLLLIIFGIVVFNRGGSKTVTTPSHKVVKLSDYKTNNNAAVDFTISGAINALENHRSIKITISPLTRNVTVFTGYEGQVLTSQTYPNDVNSYSDFLAAITRAGFTVERKIDSKISSQAICPTGSRSYYKLVDSTKDVIDLWTASCTKGSFGGNVALTNSLFQSQIPNYTKVTQGVSLSTSGGSSNGIF
ncbi:MAG: hypothetical protein ABIQ89_01290 [Candidatus Saccharimonadales bacterium]